MSLALQEIRRTPMNRLTPAQHFVLEVHKYMTEIRVEANKTKATPSLLPYYESHLRYLVGRLHGYVFGMSSLLTYGGGREEVEELFDSALSEADFLTGAYLHPEWNDYGLPC